MKYSQIPIKYLFLIFVVFPFILIGQVKKPPPPPQEIIEIDEEEFEKISNSTDRQRLTKK